MTATTSTATNRDATPGETRVFTYLEQALAAEPGASVQLRRHTGGREIDILVLAPRVGFVVIEVKDWSADVIAGSGSKMRIAACNGMRSPDSPLKQARDAALNLVKELEERDRRIRSRRPGASRLAIRWGEMCALPNISVEQWEDKGLDRYIQRPAVLLADDFEAGGVLLDATGGSLMSLLAGRANGRTPLTETEFTRLSEALAPSVAAAPSPGPGRRRFRERMIWFSKKQAREADRAAVQPTVLRGPAGSGKTLLLVDRACRVAPSSPGRNVLLTCYGIVLASRLRRMIIEQGIGVGEAPGTVLVTHFDGLVSRILGRPLEYDVEDKSYYLAAREEAARLVLGDRHGLPPFDAVLVDEGQDMDDGMMRMLLGLRAPGGEFMATMDDGQRMFRRHRTWPEGLDGVRFDHRNLPESYRATLVLQRFLARVFGEPEPDGRPETDAYFEPPSPRIHRAESDSDVAYFVAEDIAKRVKDGSFENGDIAVLYHDKWSDAGEFHRSQRGFVEDLLGVLAARAVPATWVSQDPHAKALYDATSDRVAVMSYHSAKGLEFDLVYVLGVDWLDETLANPDEVPAYLRCALTRARYELVVPYVRETASVSRLLRAVDAPKRLPTRSGTS